MRWTKILGGAAAVAAAMGMAAGEVQGQDRPLSPRGHTATELGGSYNAEGRYEGCLLYTSPSPRDGLLSRMPSSA